MATGRPESGKLAVGDEVFIIPGRGPGPGKRDDPMKATVTKAARVWLTLTADGERRYPLEWRMRRDTQREGGDSYYGNRFVTAEQLAHERAIAEADAILRDAGIRVDYGSPWRDPARRVRLAEMIQKEGA